MSFITIIKINKCESSFLNITSFSFCIFLEQKQHQVLLKSYQMYVTTVSVILLHTCSSFRETLTTTLIRRTCSSLRSMPVLFESCPGSGTSASLSAWSFWAATTRTAAVHLPAAAPVQTRASVESPPPVFHGGCVEQDFHTFWHFFTRDFFLMF